MSDITGRVERLTPKRRALLELRCPAMAGGSTPAVDDRRLVAYVAIKKETAPSVGELRRFMQQELPEYMVPSAFVILDALPLTANGKIDRHALPSPDRSRPALPESYIAPRNELERTVGAVWQEVLGIEKVGLQDNFFDLGGHSLLMVRLQSRLGTVLSTHVPIIDLFRHPTVGALARHLSAKPGVRAASFQPVQQRAEKQRELLSRRAQQRT
ncbi:MAG: phosphopantetheine-binding protein [Bryobacteraceae bacterium]